MPDNSRLALRALRLIRQAPYAVQADDGDLKAVN